MINSKQLFHDFISKIKLPIDREEMLAIAYVIFEKELDLSRTEILAAKTIDISHSARERLEQLAERLNSHEPLQYVMNSADFYGRDFIVDRAVLIPRPETEELVRKIIDTCRAEKLHTPFILDIGTGSGCIPITLALELPNSKVFALDKSAEALRVAQKNAQRLGASVQFFEHDILGSQLSLKDLDIIVSNPPYIAAEEKILMHRNVTDFEPHLALFVDNRDPLVFYRAIATSARGALKSGGFIAAEINARFGAETKQLFDDAGFINTRVEKDLAGKDRFVFAWKK